MINQNWVFGNNAGLDFTLADAWTPPTATSGSLINGGSLQSEGCASISDASGNLLFYTDGVSIWDSNHTLKVNNLLGDPSSTQSAIIVPDPSNSSKFYVLTVDGWTGTSVNSSNPINHFNGILLDISNWAATPLSSLMIMPSTAGFAPAEKLTAIQHKNCKDFWVITILLEGALNVNTKKGLGTFRVFKIDASGIVPQPDIPMNENVAGIGYLKVSQDGKNIAVANGENKNVLIYPFDNATGIVNISGLKVVPIPPSPPLPVSSTDWWVYGVEFSPSNKILYFSVFYYTQTNGYLYQVDLTQPSLPANQLTTTPTSYIGAIQLGVDNRIYFTRNGENFLGAILNPDVLGAGCNINDSYIHLAPGSLSQLGLPNLLPNACQKNGNCNCGCNGCNEDAAAQNAELIDRAKAKFFAIPSITNSNCVQPFAEHCDNNAIISHQNLEPCFYFQWGDGHNDQIEEHDTEVFYITVCNRFNDIQYNGLRIAKITLSPNTHPNKKIQIVPDRFICLDCLKPCSCQTREFALITRANNTAGHYTMEVEYCYESITFASGGNSGKAQFDLEITED